MAAYFIGLFITSSVRRVTRQVSFEDYEIGPSEKQVNSSDSSAYSSVCQGPAGVASPFTMRDHSRMRYLSGYTLTEGASSAWPTRAKEIRCVFARCWLICKPLNVCLRQNNSQFFLTLDRADALNGKYTAFGTVTGDTVYNLLKFNDLELDPRSDERPLYPPTIRSAEVIDNPFDDITPRVTAAERKEQIAARKEMRERAKMAAKRGKGTKNKGLLSFEADTNEGEVTSNGGMKSAHDLLKDEKLSKEVKDDRGFSAKLPDSFLDMPAAIVRDKGKEKSKASSKAINREEDDSFERPSKKDKKSKQTAPEPITSAQKRQSEIDALQAELLGRKGNKRDASESDDDGKQSTKDKGKGKVSKSDLDGAALLAAQRAEFLESGKAARGRKRTAESSIHPDRAGKVARKGDEDDRALNATLEDFRAGMREARKASAIEEQQNPKLSVLDTREIGYQGEILEEDEHEDDNDMSFLTHKLKFRKDVVRLFRFGVFRRSKKVLRIFTPILQTADQAKYNDYVTLDPREQGLTLEDAKAEEERRRRKGQVRMNGDARDPREGGHTSRHRQDREGGRSRESARDRR